MTKLPKWFQALFMMNVGHTYSNLSRLFLRLFTGIMFLQLGVRQMEHLEDFTNSVMGIDQTTAVTIVVIEIVCAVFLILGLFTRFALLPSIGVMVYAEIVMLSATSVTGPAGQMFFFEPGYPIMFLGIFVYMMLAGPGKISLDYLIAVHTISGEKDDEESEVLEKA